MNIISIRVYFELIGYFGNIVFKKKTAECLTSKICSLSSVRQWIPSSSIHNKPTDVIILLSTRLFMLYV